MSEVEPRDLAVLATAAWMLGPGAAANQGWWLGIDDWLILASFVGHPTGFAAPFPESTIMKALAGSIDRAVDLGWFVGTRLSRPARLSNQAHQHLAANPEPVTSLTELLGWLSQHGPWANKQRSELWFIAALEWLNLEQSRGRTVHPEELQLLRFSVATCAPQQLAAIRANLATLRTNYRAGRPAPTPERSCHGNQPG